jgi:hypothetical protein
MRDITKKLEGRGRPKNESGMDNRGRLKHTNCRLVVSKAVSKAAPQLAEKPDGFARTDYCVILSHVWSARKVKCGKNE